MTYQPLGPQISLSISPQADMGPLGRICLVIWILACIVSSLFRLSVICLSVHLLDLHFNFFSRTVGQYRPKLRTNRPWVKGIQNCINDWLIDYMLF
jgi:hypothetical protein